MASKTEVLVVGDGAKNLARVRKRNGYSAMLLVEFPLNRLFALTPLKVNMFAPGHDSLIAQAFIGSEPDRKSALTPGARMARLPRAEGRARSVVGPSCSRWPYPSLQWGGLDGYT